MKRTASRSKLWLHQHHALECRINPRLQSAKYTPLGIPFRVEVHSAASLPSFRQQESQSVHQYVEYFNSDADSTAAFYPLNSHILRDPHRDYMLKDGKSSEQKKVTSGYRKEQMSVEGT